MDPLAHLELGICDGKPARCGGRRRLPGNPRAPDSAWLNGLRLRVITKLLISNRKTLSTAQ